MQVVLNGENLVLWRSHLGLSSAWSDRCPHRGMRLSLGASYGETLVCPYHGWNFGTDGHCHHIPAHPKLAPSRAARTRIYPIAEQSGYVWVCLGEPSSAQPQPVADMFPVRTIHFPADVDVAMAALLVCPLEIAASPTGVRRRTAEDVEWTSDACGVALTATVDGERSWRFTARAELLGQISCEIEPSAGNPARYRALVQPTETGACAIHLAIEEPAAAERRLALNRSLVALRHDIGRLGGEPAVMQALEAFAQLPQDRFHA
jgi:nitrite reductase/ring-hydroxylating ferredoxin subunit